MWLQCTVFRHFSQFPRSECDCNRPRKSDCIGNPSYVQWKVEEKEHMWGSGMRNGGSSLTLCVCTQFWVALPVWFPRRRFRFQVASSSNCFSTRTRLHQGGSVVSSRTKLTQGRNPHSGFMDLLSMDECSACFCSVDNRSDKLGEQITPLFFSVDPKRDSPAQLLKYCTSNRTLLLCNNYYLLVGAQMEMRCAVRF